MLLVSTASNGENKKVETMKAIHIGDVEITFGYFLLIPFSLLIHETFFLLVSLIYQKT